MPDSSDTADQLRHFEERIARGEKIEPKDWMPDRYRQQLGTNDLSACAL